VRAPWIEEWLGPLSHNAFYLTFRQGFARRFPTHWLPGSLLPSLCVLTGFVMWKQGQGLECFTLGLGAALALSAMRAFVRATLSLSTEYSQNTWPLLILTGLTPADVLRGKFAATFYAFSGDWVYAAPIWLALLFSGHPALILLWLFQPVIIACAALCGLSAAPEPKPFVVEFSWVRVLMGIMMGIPVIGLLIVFVQLIEHFAVTIYWILTGIESLLNPITMTGLLTGNLCDVTFGCLCLFFQFGAVAAVSALICYGTLQQLTKSMHRQPDTAAA